MHRYIYIHYASYKSNGFFIYEKIFVIIRVDISGGFGIKKYERYRNLKRNKS